MWYDEADNKPIIDFTQPIVADNASGETVYVLLPCLDKGNSFETVGYNWFNVVKGEWNSCIFYPTARDAILAGTYRVSARNGTIEIKRGEL